MIPEYAWRQYDDLIVIVARTSGSLGQTDALARLEQARRRLDSEGMLRFLAEIGLVAGGVTTELTSEGRAYFLAQHVRNDRESARAVLRAALEKHAETILICQTLYGCSGLDRDNVEHLLRASDDYEGTDLNVNPFLMVLSQAGIVKFSTKSGSVTVLWQPDAAEEPPPHSFLSSRTPYSNIKRLRQVLRSLRGKICWIDKHFDRKAFDALSDTADGASWNSVTIVSTDCNLTASARSDYERLKTELANRGIRLEWRICTKSSASTFHDRWLIGDNGAYNIPPVNTIYKGQDAEIHKTEVPPNLVQYLSNSTPV